MVFAAIGPDDGKVNVGREKAPGQRVVFPKFYRRGIAQSKIGARNRVQGLHLVAPVNAEPVCDRTDAVRRIGIRTADRFVGTGILPPVGFVRIVETVVAHIMKITALDMNGLAEQPFLFHVQHRQRIIVEIAVFQNHAVLPRLLGGIDQLPALRDISCCGNLDGDMFAVLHGMNRNRGVQACPRRDIDKINVIAFTDFLPVVPAGVIIDS